MLLEFPKKYVCFLHNFSLYIFLFISEKPKLHLDGLYGKMIRVRAGDPVYINIPMTGSPLPTVRWVFNKQHLQDTPRTRQEVLEDLIKLTFPKTERSDSGVYTIEVKNAYGEDSADITLFVYGKYFDCLLQNDAFYFIDLRRYKMHKLNNDTVAFEHLAYRPLNNSK